MNAPVQLLNEPEKLHLRVEHFEQLEESGAFADRVKAELIDGDIYVLNAQFACHGGAKVRLIAALFNWVEENRPDLDVFSEVSVRVAADSMPEPDVFVAKRQGYGAVPVESVALVVEVSDATLAMDIGRKAELYAVAGAPEYWVVDLTGGCVFVHVQPGPAGYERRLRVSLGDRIVAATIPGLEVDTARLVG